MCVAVGMTYGLYVICLESACVMFMCEKDCASMRSLPGDVQR